MTRVALAFLPWAIFVIVDRSAGHGTAWAGLVSAVAALAVVLYSWRARSNVAFPFALAVLFTGVGVAARVADGIDVFTEYGRVWAAGGVALIALGSLIVQPVTVAYTRELVLPRTWADPDFRRVNVLLTAMCGAIFTVIACSHEVAGLLDTPTAATVFNWVVPIALLLGGVRYASEQWHRHIDEDVVGVGGLINAFDTPFGGSDPTSAGSSEHSERL